MKMLSRFARDESGAYLVVSAIAMPVLVGGAALGTEAALRVQEQRALQGAVDEAAITAATAYYRDGEEARIDTEAVSVLAMRGLKPQTPGLVVAVNRPPLSGSHATLVNAVEVIVRRRRPRLFSAIWSQDPIELAARAVAKGTGGEGCVLALNAADAGAMEAAGNPNITLKGCSLIANSSHSSALTVAGSATINTQSVSVVGGIVGSDKIAAVDGIHAGQPPASDPYREVEPPSFTGCDQTNYSTSHSVTLSPGVYCGGLQIHAGANVVLNPGIYYLDRGSLSVNGTATLSGVGVTLVFTSSNGQNHASATINGGATIDLTAPTTGPTAGIVIFGDRTMNPETRFRFTGGASQSLRGAVYVPKGALQFSGSAGSGQSCTQLIGDTISFTGSADLVLDCSGVRTRPIASAAAALVE